MKALVKMLIWIVALSTAAIAPAPAHDVPDDDAPRDYRRGGLRLAAFAITNIDTTIVARSESLPLGFYIDLNKDLGLSDSETVPRVFFHYRFARRHQLDLDWFDLTRSSTKVAERTIEIGGSVIEVGSTMEVESGVSNYKLLYTYLFYDRGKVRLGASAGLNFLDFDLKVQVDPSDSPPILEVDEDAGVLAPLPVVGFRLDYNATNRLNLAFVADLLAVDIGDYSGILQDIYFVADYRLTKWFGLGGGINSLSFNMKVDNNDALAELRHNYRGFLGFASFRF